MKSIWSAASILLAGIICAGTAHAATFKSLQECTVGGYVANESDEPGVVTGISNSASLCHVKMDRRGDVQHSIFWMLHDAGGSTYRFHLDATSRQITFDNGPFAGEPAKLADGPSIDFSAISCSLEK